MTHNGLADGDIERIRNAIAEVSKTKGVSNGYTYRKSVIRNDDCEARLVHSDRRFANPALIQH